MDIISLINIFGILIILTSLIDFKISLALYLSFIILVPFVHIEIGGYTIYENRLLPLLFIFFLYHYYKRSHMKLDFKIVLPFIFLFIAILYLSFFNDEVPFSYQLTLWSGTFITVGLVSFIVWNQINVEPKTISYLKWSLIGSLFIACIYGIYLSQINGDNVYTSLLSQRYNIMDSAGFFTDNVKDSRLSFTKASKIQSTAVHPMTWSLLLCFSLVFTFIQLVKTKALVYWGILILLLSNLLISGVRTGIAATAIAGIYFLIRYKKSKSLLIGGIIACVLLVVIDMNPDLSNLFSSFVDISGKKSDVSGSSIQMRLSQLNGALDVIKGHEWFGRGYGWAQYYLEIHGTHPVLLAFESLFFIVICNSGIAGIIVWSLFFVALFRIPRKVLTSKFDIYTIDSLIILFFFYTMGTGEYGYMKFFALFYSFLLGLLLNMERTNQAATCQP